MRNDGWIDIETDRLKISPFVRPAYFWIPRIHVNTFLQNDFKHGICIHCSTPLVWLTCGVVPKNIPSFVLPNYMNYWTFGPQLGIMTDSVWTTCGAFYASARAHVFVGTIFFLVFVFSHIYWPTHHFVRVWWVHKQSCLQNRYGMVD